MRQIVEEVSPVNVVNVAVVAVSPSVRPCIRDLEVVTSISEVRTASDNGHVSNREVMVMAEMSAKMGIVNATHMLVVPDFRVVLFMFIMMLFLAGSVIVMVFVLGKDGDRSGEEPCSTYGDDYSESFHGETSYEICEMTAARKIAAPTLQRG